MAKRYYILNTKKLSIRMACLGYTDTSMKYVRSLADKAIPLAEITLAGDF